LIAYPANELPILPPTNPPAAPLTVLIAALVTEIESPFAKSCPAEPTPLAAALTAAVCLTALLAVIAP